MLNLLRRMAPKAAKTDTRAKVDAPSMVPEITGPVPHPDLITVEEAKAMPMNQMAELFNTHLNPGQYHFMKLLGFHKIKIESAEGMYYTDQNGRKILDFFGGFGSL
ncbi:aspartate aminotransferase family protein, partial [Rhizobiaceae bacterium]|nr:aspartate aminotransferase family protein [Rhizobiaceae bacterium]